MKRKSVQRILTLLLAVMLLSGCANDTSDGGTQQSTEQKTGGVSGDEYNGNGPITTQSGQSLTILGQTSNYSNVDIAEAPIVKKVVEDSGISVEWQLIDFNSYADSVSPMLGSGQVDADIILLPDNDETQKYIKSGMFEPLSDHFDIMPNYVKWLDEHPDTKAAMTAQDGKIYYMPKTDDGKNFLPCVMYNQVWLDKAGKEMPATLDDFVELLRYFRDNDMNGNGDTADEIPMSVTASYLPYLFAPAFGLDLRSGFQGDESGKVTYAYADKEKYRAYVEFMRDLYEEGLLEVEYTSLTRDQVIERMSNDLTGVGCDHSWAMSMMYSVVLPYYDGTAETGFVGGRPLASDISEGFMIGQKGYGQMRGVNANSDNIELACKFLDFAYSEANQEMYCWGIEGESYTVDAEGNKVYTEQASDNDWLQQLGINPQFVLPANTSKEATYALLPDWHVEIDLWQEQFVKDPWPFIYSTDEEAEVMNTYMADITTYAEENTTAFINGTKSLDTFDSYIAGFDALHLQDVLDVKQATYNRYLENLK